MGRGTPLPIRPPDRSQHRSHSCRLAVAERATRPPPASEYCEAIRLPIRQRQRVHASAERVDHGRNADSQRLGLPSGHHHRHDRRRGNVDHSGRRGKCGVARGIGGAGNRAWIVGESPRIEPRDDDARCDHRRSGFRLPADESQEPTVQIGGVPAFIDYSVSRRRSPQMAAFPIRTRGKRRPHRHRQARGGRCAPLRTCGRRRPVPRLGATCPAAVPSGRCRP